MLDAVLVRARALAGGTPPERDALRRGAAGAARGRAGRRDAARALPDRHQRARGHPLPARAHAARSRSPARWPARSPPAAASARRCRGGSSTASASAACCRRSASSTPRRSARSWPSAELERADGGAGRLRLRRPGSRSRRPRPCCARCGRRCCAIAPSCCSPPTRWTRCMIELIFIPGPLLTGADHRARLARGGADRLRGQRHRGHAALHRAAALARLAAATTRRSAPACSARCARPACAAWC